MYQGRQYSTCPSPGHHPPSICSQPIFPPLSKSKVSKVSSGSRGQSGCSRAIQGGLPPQTLPSPHLLSARSQGLGRMCHGQRPLLPILWAPPLPAAECLPRSPSPHQHCLLSWVSAQEGKFGALGHLLCTLHPTPCRQDPLMWQGLGGSMGGSVWSPPPPHWVNPQCQIKAR